MGGMRGSGGPRRALSVMALAVAVTVAGLVAPHGPASIANAGAASTGIHKIKHVIVIMQENRSFDELLRHVPGRGRDPEEGLQRQPREPAVRQGLRRSTTTSSTISRTTHVADTTRGEQGQDGRLRESGRRRQLRVSIRRGAMSHHTGSDIPNYWSYAKTYVLQDHMFAPARSWSLPEHLFMVSAWSAKCKNHNAMDCTSDVNGPAPAPPLYNDPLHVKIDKTSPIYAWTDVTYLLHKHHVSWSYYVVAGAEPDCAVGAQISCAPRPLKYRRPATGTRCRTSTRCARTSRSGTSSRSTGSTRRRRPGTLPAVSWITPSQDLSEHPPAAISSGMAYVTSLVNAVMRGPDWKSTAIFVAWDDWGGFYDHVKPPRSTATATASACRVSSISPYARKGYIDHQTLSFDAYLKFIEDDFMSSRRLDPRTDGRPDRRPDRAGEREAARRRREGVRLHAGAPPAEAAAVASEDDAAVDASVRCRWSKSVTPAPGKVTLVVGRPVE